MKKAIRFKIIFPVLVFFTVGNLPASPPTTSLPKIYNLFRAHEFEGSGHYDDGNGAVILRPGLVKVADMDSDGDPDFVVVGKVDIQVAGTSIEPSYWCAPAEPPGPSCRSDVAWAENVTGEGDFIFHYIRQPTGENIHIYDAKSMDVADVDNDGDMDIALISNTGGNPCGQPFNGSSRTMWLRNQKAVPAAPGPPGPFQQNLLTEKACGFPVWNTGRDIHIHDMNNDGFRDILGASLNGGGYNSDWWMNDGAGGFTTATNVKPRNILLDWTDPTQTYNGDIIFDIHPVPDINFDGYPEIAYARNNPGGAPPPHKLELLVSSVPAPGTTFYYQPQTVKDNYGAIIIATGDFNMDGLVDLVAGGRKMPDNRNAPLTIFLNNGAGGWTESQLPYATDMIYATNFRAIDFNFDGYNDLVAGTLGNRYTTYLQGMGLTSGIVIYLSPGATQDADSNGILDATEWDISAWRDLPVIEQGTSNLYVTFDIADFDGDGDLDIVRGIVESNLVWYENVMNTNLSVMIKSVSDMAKGKLGKSAQTVTKFLSVNPDGSIGSGVGENVRSSGN